ncbi:MAG TPA: urease accessory UreF family protein [Tepidisphaeraceae bacterium]
MNRIESPTSPWLVWQVIDSAFPVGGFAHSGGLEAAVQLGYVTDAASLEAFLHVCLSQTAQFAAPFVAAVVQAPGEFDDLNARYDTLLVNDPANRASRALGAAVLAAGETVVLDGEVAAVREAVRQRRGFAHLPLSFGLLSRSVGLNEAAAVDAFLFQQARGLLSAAVRLGVVGPMESQRMLAGLADHRDRWNALALQTTPDSAAQTAPLLDLLQSLHERLYSRLFNS